MAVACPQPGESQLDQRGRDSSLPAPMIPKRDKMVNFRVSNEEYMFYRQVCAANGLHNFSELARLAIRHFAAPDHGRALIVSEVRDIQARMQVLAAEVEHLVQKVDHPSGALQE